MISLLCFLLFSFIPALGGQITTSRQVHGLDCFFLFLGSGRSKMIIWRGVSERDGMNLLGVPGALLGHGSGRVVCQACGPDAFLGVIF